MVIVMELLFIHLFNQALVILGLGAVIYSDKYDISVLPGVAFKVFLPFDLTDCFFSRAIVLKFNQDKP